jgi:hypothetical protein
MICGVLQGLVSDATTRSVTPSSGKKWNGSLWSRCIREKARIDTVQAIPPHFTYQIMKVRRWPVAAMHGKPHLNSPVIDRNTEWTMVIIKRMVNGVSRPLTAQVY